MIFRHRPGPDRIRTGMAPLSGCPSLSQRGRVPCNPDGHFRPLGPGDKWIVRCLSAIGSSDVIPRAFPRIFSFLLVWLEGQGSNLQPLIPKTSALPVELPSIMCPGDKCGVKHMCSP